VGPLAWWSTSLLPQEIAAAIVWLGVYVVPTCMSARSLLDVRRIRISTKSGSDDDSSPSQLSLSVTIRAFMAGAPPEAPLKPFSEGLTDRLRFWVSYWSCWPVLHFVYLLLAKVDDGSKATAYGLLLAVVLWMQLWRGSRVAPLLCNVAATGIKGLSTRAGVLARPGGHLAKRVAAGVAAGAMQAVSAGGPETVGAAFHGNRWLLVGVAAAIAFACASILLRVIALAQAFVSLAILLVAAGDSARCAATGHAEELPARLAFWVIAVIWLSLRHMPFVGALPWCSWLHAWTPLVLLVAIVAGESLLNALVWRLIPPQNE